MYIQPSEEADPSFDKSGLSLIGVQAACAEIYSKPMDEVAQIIAEHMEFFAFFGGHPSENATIVTKSVAQHIDHTKLLQWWAARLLGDDLLDKTDHDNPNHPDNDDTSENNFSDVQKQQLSLDALAGVAAQQNDLIVTYNGILAAHKPVGSTEEDWMDAIIWAENLPSSTKESANIWADAAWWRRYLSVLWRRVEHKIFLAELAAQQEMCAAGGIQPWVFWRLLERSFSELHKNDKTVEQLHIKFSQVCWAYRNARAQTHIQNTAQQQQQNRGALFKHLQNLIERAPSSGIAAYNGWMAAVHGWGLMMFHLDDDQWPMWQAAVREIAHNNALSTNIPFHMQEAWNTALALLASEKTIAHSSAA